MKRWKYLSALWILTACAKESGAPVAFAPRTAAYRVDKNEKTVWFDDTVTTFVTQTVETKEVPLSLKAPAYVVARVQGYNQLGRPVVIFDDAEKSNILANYLQKLDLLKLAEANAERVRDLYENGAATGKDLIEARAEVTQIQSDVSAAEIELMEKNFNPADLKTPKVGTTWLICDLPESEMNTLHKGMPCRLEFPGYPGEAFTGTIDAVAAVLNIQTRKVRVRIVVHDAAGRFRPGMYATASFDFGHTGLMIPRGALFSAGARYYVFVESGKNRFTAREITVSTDAGPYVEVHAGLRQGESIVVNHVYLLKGLVFGI
ncbi:MAG: efflux RND transporter periplasmic adaptor subunit [Bacteroidia bacterium]|nr:efflux RND transporter periplasmic adaptor subunit [Bacteroidia bacterium]